MSEYETDWTPSAEQMSMMERDWADEERERRDGFIALWRAIGDNVEQFAPVFALLASSTGDDDWTSERAAETLSAVGLCKSLSSELVDYVLFAASRAGLLVAHLCDDGDEDSHPTTDWYEFSMLATVRFEIATIGAQRWLDVQVARGLAAASVQATT